MPHVYRTFRSRHYEKKRSLATAEIARVGGVVTSF